MWLGRQTLFYNQQSCGGLGQEAWMILDKSLGVFYHSQMMRFDVLSS
ncbi:hypothetical protein [Moraxella lacunata]